MPENRRSGAGVVLAAGLGKRMKSDLPKVFHSIGGRPMVAYVLDALSAAGVGEVYLVIGHRGELLREYFGESGITFVEQRPQRGTGHAVLQTTPFWMTKKGTLFVLNGDVPFIRPSTLEELREAHEGSGAAATVLTTHMPDPTGYGRIVRTPDGRVEKIVEDKDARPRELGITEINTGAFCFKMELLFPVLQKIRPENAQGEFYLTDALSLLREEGHAIAAHTVLDPREVAGINTRAELARAEKIFQDVIARVR